MNRRSFISTAAAILATAAVPFKALAGRSWCRVEPTVSIDGDTYVIEVFAYLPDRTIAYTPMTGQPSNFLIKHPSGQSHSVVSTDSGVDGEGETVSWGTQISGRSVMVTIHTDAAYEAYVVVNGVTVGSGYTNTAFGGSF